MKLFASMLDSIVENVWFNNLFAFCLGVFLLLHFIPLLWCVKELILDIIHTIKGDRYDWYM